MIDLGGPLQGRVDTDVFLPVEARMGEGDLDQVADRVADACGNDTCGNDAGQVRGGSLTTLTKNWSIWRTTLMNASKSTGLAT